MKKLLGLLLSIFTTPYAATAILFLAIPAFGACPDAVNNAGYVRKGASGNGSGVDWINACTDFTGSCAASSLVRGCAYYVASGAYGTVAFSTADSGTALITILGATVAAHGTATGWNSAFSVNAADGGAQATFAFGSSDNVELDSDHWVFDGAVGPSPFTSPASTAYGFLLLKAGNCNTQPMFGIATNPGGSQTDITIKHVAKVDCGLSFNTNQTFIGLGGGSNPLSTVYVGYTYYTTGNGALSQTNVSNEIVEFNYWFNIDFAGSNSNKETIGNNCTGTASACQNNTVRYNRFDTIGTVNGGYTGCIAGLGSGNTVAIDTWSIYGNVFNNCQTNSGLIGCINTFACVNVKIYNNTFVSITSGAILAQCNLGGGGACGSASGNIVENNILYASLSTLFSGGGGAITNDYNSYLSSTDGGNSETHGQVVTLNPFVNSASNWHLTNDGVASCASTSAVCTGLTLSSPFTTDPDGNTRGSDGTWERGAYEFVVSGSLAPPTNVHVTPIEKPEL